MPEVHKEWCGEHEEGEGCASEWRGSEDERGAHLLHRILQRPGEAPVVQVSLNVPGEGELVAEFAPDTLRRFAADFAADVAAAQHA